MQWNNNTLLKFSCVGLSVVAAVAFAAYWQKRGVSFQNGWRADEVDDDGPCQFRVYGGDGTETHGKCVKDAQFAVHLMNQITNT